MGGVPSRFARAGLLLAIIVVSGSRSRSAAAADDRQTHDLAREAYDRGTLAHGRGEYAKAAEEFARADALEPSAVALQAALDAAILANDAALGAELLERTTRATSEGALIETTETARKRFAGRTGRVRIECGRAVSCLATIDGASIDVKIMPFVVVGSHTVIVQRDGQPRQQLIRVRAEEVTYVWEEPPTPSASAAPAPGGQGLSPIWVFAGAGVFALLGGATLVSGLDTASKHADFVAAGCPGRIHDDCSESSSSGASAQLRTNVLLGATALTGLATAAIGVFFVQWRTAPLVSVGSISGRPGLAFRAAF